MAGGLKAGLVAWIAALGARSPPRKPGIEGLIPAMVLTGIALAIPLFALQLSALRLMTRGRPMLHEPYLTMGIDSIGIGVIVAAELIGRWGEAIESELGRYDDLEYGARLRRRLLRIGAGLAATAGTAGLLWLALRKP